MKMKKMLMLVLVLTIASVASAGVSLQQIAAGEPGSASNPLAASDTIQILVTSDVTLISLDAVLTVSDGPGTITGAMNLSDVAAYGWDAGLSFDPIITGTTANLGGGNFADNSNSIMGYFTLHCDGPGDVVVTLTPGSAFGGSFDTTYSPYTTIGGSLTIYQVPEPITMSLLGLGGLFLRRRK